MRWYYNKRKNICERLRIVQEATAYSPFCICKLVTGKYKELELYVHVRQLYDIKQDALEAAQIRLEREAESAATRSRNCVKFLEAFVLKHTPTTRKRRHTHGR